MNDSENAPNPEGENMPNEDSGHRQTRRYTKTQTIVDFAVDKYRKRREGLTHSDLQIALRCSKPSAQAKLKRLRKSKKLFSIGRKKPQQFFPVSLKGEIVEDLSKNALKRTTGIGGSKSSSVSGNALLTLIEQQKGRNLLDDLLKAGTPPLLIHNIQLNFKIDKGKYPELPIAAKGNHKITTKSLDGIKVTFIFSPNGTVSVYIGASERPFLLGSELDVSMIFAFFGRICGIVKDFMNDSAGLVPMTELGMWRLKRCDFNIDEPITALVQISLPDIQLVTAEAVFRQYVKVIDGKAVLRTEVKPSKLDMHIKNLMSLVSSDHSNRGIAEKLDAIHKGIQGLEEVLKSSRDVRHSDA